MSGVGPGDPRAVGAGQTGETLSITAYTNRADCRKRSFGGPGDARRAHRHASYRIRVYKCEDCGGWHVTNNEKRHHAERWNDR